MTDSLTGSSGNIRYEVDDERIGIITIDRPEKRNAMSYPVLRDFIATVADAGDDERSRVIIVTGAGGAFCAGTDLSNLSDTPTDQRGTRGRRQRQLAAGRRGRWCRAPSR